MQTVNELELLDDAVLLVAASDSHELEVAGMIENGERESRT